MRTVHLLRVAAFLLGSLMLVVLGAAPASASCATDSPRPSPHMFLGTVIETSKDGRVAEVSTDAGETVIVEGTQHTSRLTDSYTSVDRTYVLGGRYEFHPLNDASPYSDNACTGTRQLSGPTLPPQTEPPVRDGVLPSWLPVDEQAGPLGHLIFFGSLTVAALALLPVVRRLVHQRRSEPKVDSTT